MKADKLIVATGNPSKLIEIRAILAQYPAFSNTELLTMREMGFTEEIEENGRSFYENALIKAKTVWDFLGGQYFVLAEDSGLEIDVLNGGPGIYSARWLSECASNAEKNLKVLDILKDVPEEERGCHFRTVAVLLVPEGLEPKQLFCEGLLFGKIAWEPAGDGGFGYDPIFYLPELGKTMAEMGTEYKNTVSHRSQALRGIADLFAEKFPEE